MLFTGPYCFPNPIFCGCWISSCFKLPDIRFKFIQFLQNFSKVVVLGRRNATVPEEYQVNQTEAEKEGRLVQVTVGWYKVNFLSLDYHIKNTLSVHFISDFVRCMKMWWGMPRDRVTSPEMVQHLALTKITQQSQVCQFHEP